jgi:hypothetical protein
VERLKELVAKLKSQQRPYGELSSVGRSRQIEREEIVRELEDIISQMEADELSEHLLRRYHD